MKPAARFATRAETVIGLLITLISLVAMVWWILAIFGVIEPVNKQSPNLSSPALFWLLAEHAAIGLVMFLGVFGAGMGFLVGMPARWRLTSIDRRLLAMPIGLIIWLAASIIIRMADWPGWLALIIVFALAAVAIKSRRHLTASLALTSLPETARTLTALILILGLIFGAFFGLVWRLPTQFAGGTVDLGDLGCYVATYYALKAHIYPYLSLAIEGDNLGTYTNSISSFLALSFDELPGFEYTFFLTTSVAFFFLYSLCYGVRHLLAYRQEIGLSKPSPVVIVTVILLICAATRYPSWIVESPPYAFAAPLILPIIYLAARGVQRPMFFYPLLPLTLVAFAITKIVVVAVLCLYVFCCFWRRVITTRNRTGFVILATGAATVAAFAMYMLAAYGEHYLSFSSADYFGPKSLIFFFNKVFVQHGHILKALQKTMIQESFGPDLAPLILLIGTLMLRDWALRISAAIGIALCSIYPFLFNATGVSAFLLVGGWLLLDKRSQPSRWATGVLAVAAVIMLYGHFRNDPGSWLFSMVWITVLGSALYLTFQMADSPQASERAPNAIAAAHAWHFLLPAAGLCMVLALCTGTFRWGDRDRSVVPSKLYDLWLAVRANTPADALIFSDQTGPSPGRLEGWNDLAITSARQFYIVSWSMSPLRGNEPALTERLNLNKEVLSGKITPGQLALSRSYGNYFAAVHADWHAVPGAELLYNNGDYALYRLPRYN